MFGVRHIVEVHRTDDEVARPVHDAVNNMVIGFQTPDVREYQRVSPATF